MEQEEQRLSDIAVEIGKIEHALKRRDQVQGVLTIGALVGTVMIVGWLFETIGTNGVIRFILIVLGIFGPIFAFHAVGAWWSDAVRDATERDEIRLRQLNQEERDIEAAIRRRETRASLEASR